MTSSRRFASLWIALSLAALAGCEEPHPTPPPAPPEVADAEREQPEAQQPEAQQPEAQQPEAQQPEPKQPEPKQPEPKQPEPIRPEPQQAAGSLLDEELRLARAERARALPTLAAPKSEPAGSPLLLHSPGSETPARGKLLTELSYRYRQAQATGELEAWRRRDLFELRGTAAERERDAFGRTVRVRLGDAVETFSYRGDRLVRHDRADGTWTDYLQAPSRDGRRAVGEQRHTSEGEVVQQYLHTYDDQDRPLSVRAPETLGWSFVWEGQRLIGEDGPRGRRDYRYDDHGRLQELRDASKRSVYVQRQASEEGSKVIATTARGERSWQQTDAQGLFVAAGAEGSAAVSVERDRFGRVVQVSGEAALRFHRDAPAPYARTEEHTLVTPWGEVARRYRDASGGAYLSVLEAACGAFRFTNPAAPTERVGYPNRVISVVERDANRRVVSLRSAPLELGYVWQDHRLVLSARDGVRTHYGYDELGRLESERCGDEARFYRCDADGRRVAERAADGRALVTRYDERGWIASRGEERFRHDAAGRLVERKHAGGVDRFRYDGFGRLVEAQRAGGPAVHYRYDGLGRIAGRRVGEAGETRYVYEGLDLVAELGPGRRVRLYLNGPALDQHLAYLDEEGRWTFLHPDDLGTVLAYTDAKGQVLGKARYTAFGVPAMVPAGQPLFFAGQPYDPIARLVPCRARFYDPELGRFLTPDPAGIRDGFDPFVYADGNPTDRTDPLGLYTAHGFDRRFLGGLGQEAQLQALIALSRVYFAPDPQGTLQDLPGKRFPETVEKTAEAPRVRRRAGNWYDAQLATQIALESIRDANGDWAKHWRKEFPEDEAPTAAPAREGQQLTPEQEHRRFALAQAAAQRDDQYQRVLAEFMWNSRELEKMQHFQQRALADPSYLEEVAKTCYHGADPEHVVQLMAEQMQEARTRVERWEKTFREEYLRVMPEARYWESQAERLFEASSFHDEDFRAARRAAARRQVERELTRRRSVVMLVGAKPNYDGALRRYAAFAKERADRDAALAARRAKLEAKRGRGRMSVTAASPRQPTPSAAPTISSPSRRRARGGVSVAPVRRGASQALRDEASGDR
ncbi:MAG: RHS repeat-associated core domain-containing protein [Planctomycetota bacterium]